MTLETFLVLLALGALLVVLLPILILVYVIRAVIRRRARTATARGQPDEDLFDEWLSAKGLDRATLTSTELSSLQPEFDTFRRLVAAESPR